MQGHLHTGIGAVVFVTVAAIVGFNVVRIGAAMAAKSQNSAVAKIGKSVGATVTFGGS
jgi:hypothetical protein